MSAAYLLLGKVYDEHEGGELGVGGSTVVAALLEVTGEVEGLRASVSNVCLIALCWCFCCPYFEAQSTCHPC